MWINGKEIRRGAGRGRQGAEQSTPRLSAGPRTPGCWNTSANDLLQMKVFPVPAKGDQKVALTFNAVVPKESNLVEYNLSP